jgi:molybdopterin-guanine dinucleotide biosynthesis protein A
MKPDQIEAFILAGGASRRMGTDKSQLLLEHRTFTERIAHTLLQLSDSVTIVGRTIPPFRSVPDVYPQWGALGGLHAALSACTREWAIIAACDLPFVTAEFFKHLANLRRLALRRHARDAQRVYLGARRLALRVPRRVYAFARRQAGHARRAANAAQRGHLAIPSDAPRIRSFRERNEQSLGRRF